MSIGGRRPLTEIAPAAPVGLAAHCAGTIHRHLVAEGQRPPPRSAALRQAAAWLTPRSGSSSRLHGASGEGVEPRQKTRVRSALKGARTAQNRRRPLPQWTHHPPRRRSSALSGYSAGRNQRLGTPWSVAKTLRQPTRTSRGRSDLDADEWADWRWQQRHGSAPSRNSSNGSSRRP